MWQVGANAVGSMPGSRKGVNPSSDIESFYMIEVTYIDTSGIADDLLRERLYFIRPLSLNGKNYLNEYCMYLGHFGLNFY